MRTCLIAIGLISLLDTVFFQMSYADAAHLPLKIYDHAQNCKQLASGVFYQCEVATTALSSVFAERVPDAQSFLARVPIKVLVNIENSCLANGPVNVQFINEAVESSETRIGAGQSSRIESVFAGSAASYALKIRYSSATQIFPNCSLQISSLLETKDLMFVKEHLMGLKDLSRTLFTFADQVSASQGHSELLRALELSLALFNSQIEDVEQELAEVSGNTFESETKRSELRGKMARIQAAAAELQSQKDTLFQCESLASACIEVNANIRQFLDNQNQSLHAEVLEIEHFLKDEVQRIAAQETKIQREINELLSLITAIGRGSN